LVRQVFPKLVPLDAGLVFRATLHPLEPVLCTSSSLEPGPLAELPAPTDPFGPEAAMHDLSQETEHPAPAGRHVKLCLIRPPAVESFRFATTTITLPLGLAYIAGAVEESGRPLEVVDAVALAPGRKTRYFKGVLVGLRLEEIVERVPADCNTVGITVIFTHEWPAVVRLIALLKEARPDLTVILGGEHISSAPEFCLATSAADFLVLGEGEETIIDLLDALESGGSPAGIAGLAFRDGELISVNARRARRRAPWSACLRSPGRCPRRRPSPPAADRRRAPCAAASPRDPCAGPPYRGPAGRSAAPARQPR